MRSKDLWYLSRLIRSVRDDAIVPMGRTDFNIVDKHNVLCIRIQSESPIFGTAEGRILVPDLMAGADPYSSDEVVWEQDGKSHTVDGIKYRHRYHTGGKDCSASMDLNKIWVLIRTDLSIPAKRFKTMAKMSDSDMDMNLGVYAINGRKGTMVMDTCYSDCGEYSGEDITSFFPNSVYPILMAMRGGDAREFRIHFGNQTVAVIEEKYRDWSIQLITAPLIVNDDKLRERLKNQF